MCGWFSQSSALFSSSSWVRTPSIITLTRATLLLVIFSTCSAIRCWILTCYCGQLNAKTQYNSNFDHIIANFVFIDSYATLITAFFRKYFSDPIDKATADCDRLKLQVLRVVFLSYNAMIDANVTKRITILGNSWNA